MADSDWSNEHISRANRLALHVVVAWVVLVVVSAALAGTGGFGPLVVGVLSLAAVWLLVHSLFSQVDGLVRTRLEAADSLDARPEDGGARDGSDG
ncbi:hypothetical protein [Halobacterium jilantaiense]|uniref:Uncharacterized protein n=1 Tax=Halobacterium jilantaiense TaxID=355548 RepID=A0A1I0PHA2_9EURY|nr:hypothetical protein [Halobacterium jilantaiense]SEW13757.1 hypothetical protein SAMN04487945_1691 [Halobacterium jilantaiense]